MNTAFQFFYGLLSPFLWNPELAFMVAAAFVVLTAASAWHCDGFKPLIHLTGFFAAFLWILFGLNEIRARAAGWNIRVDLLFGWPVLFLVSLLAAWLALHSFGERKSNQSN